MKSKIALLHKAEVVMYDGDVQFIFRETQKQSDILSKQGTVETHIGMPNIPRQMYKTTISGKLWKD